MVHLTVVDTNFAYALINYRIPAKIQQLKNCVSTVVNFPVCHPTSGDTPVAPIPRGSRMAVVLAGENAKEWSYRGEGAVNLVLAYSGESPSFVRSSFSLSFSEIAEKLVVFFKYE